MFKVTVNDKQDHIISNEDGQLLLDEAPTSADIKQLSPSLWHVIDQLRSYNVEVVSFDRAIKTAEIKVNNNTYHVSAKDQFDILLDKMGLSNSNTAKISDLKAPMPGLVLKVLAEPGTAVTKGDNIFILEAMKMENIIKAPTDAVIKDIKVKAGEKVEKGQILLQFD